MPISRVKFIIITHVFHFIANYISVGAYNLTVPNKLSRHASTSKLEEIHTDHIKIVGELENEDEGQEDKCKEVAQDCKTQNNSVSTTSVNQSQESHSQQQQQSSSSTQQSAVSQQQMLSSSSSTSMMSSSTSQSTQMFSETRSSSYQQSSSESIQQINTTQVNIIKD